MKWISVKDQLPTEEKRVLVYDRFKKECTGCYSSNMSWHALPDQDYAIDNYLFDVTHWMPLPDQPSD